MIYTVSYTLNPKRDATALLVELQKFGKWIHAIDDTWIIGTDESSLVLWNRLAPYFEKTDRVLVAEFPTNASYQGWLTQEAWDWLIEMRAEYG